jgi:hypothetical protein
MLQIFFLYGVLMEKWCMRTYLFLYRTTWVWFLLVVN